ncbi:MAG: response regulator [Bacteroidota bacterium]
MKKVVEDKGMILVVDDAPESVTDALAALKKEGYMVSLTTNGEEALQQPGVEMLDLILLDTKMNGTDVSEIFREFKAQETTRAIPIILVSDSVEAFDKEKAYALGAVDYLVKPIPSEELLARVNMHIMINHLGKGLLEANKYLKEQLTDTTSKFAKVDADLRLSLAERTQTDEELQFANAMLKAQQELFQDGVLVVDKEGKMISCNKRFVDMWKIPTAAMVSMYDDNVFKPVLSKLAKPDELLTRINYLNEHLDEKSFDELKLNDGSVFEHSSAPVFGPDWKYYGRIWNFRDITNRKREEEEFKKANEELEQLRDRTIQLDGSVLKLRQEVTDRKRSEEEIKKIYDGLKKRIQDRATQLEESVRRLRQEINQQNQPDKEQR